MRTSLIILAVEETTVKVFLSKTITAPGAGIETCVCVKKESCQRLVILTLQNGRAEAAVKPPYLDCGVYEILPGTEPSPRGFAGVVLILYLPEKFLQYVFHGHQPVEPSVLIDHYRYVYPVHLELPQKSPRGLGAWDEIRFSQALAHRGRKVVLGKIPLQKILAVENARYVVLLLLVNRDPGAAPPLTRTSRFSLLRWGKFPCVPQIPFRLFVPSHLAQ